MHTQRRSGLSLTKRLLVAMTAIVSMFGVATVTSPAAHATVYGSCTLSRCPAAVSANSGWSSLGYPTSRGWYNWSGGSCNFAGGEYYNYDGQLPSGDTFYEYDVYPRRCGASRDAYRIVVDQNTGTVWFSPNHYTDFYQL